GAHLALRIRRHGGGVEISATASRIAPGDGGLRSNSVERRVGDTLEVARLFTEWNRGRLAGDAELVRDLLVG
ncbi:MAG: hypothetical protein K6T28_10155, partial [Acidothermus sp.]|nr:hypothetical protein [Acidothermus sp.]